MGATSNERSADLHFLAHIAPFRVDRQTQIRYSPAGFLNKMKSDAAFNLGSDRDALAPNLILSASNVIEAWNSQRLPTLANFRVWARASTCE
jgi:hypothetical protein